jgi:ATP-dependent RNA circularization protein (DNA/RNA ligase family)
MSTNASLSLLYQEVEHLDNSTLDVFIAQLQALRTNRYVSDKQKKEADLLKKINKTLTVSQLQRFQILNQKRLEGNLDQFDQSELEGFVEKIENLHVQRVKNLALLAQLRNVSLYKLMAELDINPILHG